MKCRNGLLELLARTLTLSWEEDGSAFGRPGDRVSRHEQVIYPPFILASTSASVTYSALDRSDFNLGRAVELTEVVNFIILVLGADGAMSNIRLFAWMLSKVVECNSRARREGRGLLLLLMT
eukprot:3285513-Pyramimonas_sp.AAC.1